jgi:hypothetical protein
VTGATVYTGLTKSLDQLRVGVLYGLYGYSNSCGISSIRASGDSGADWYDWLTKMGICRNQKEWARTFLVKTGYRTYKLLVIIRGWRVTPRPAGLEIMIAKNFYIHHQPLETIMAVLLL